MTQTSAIEVEHLSHRYGARPALEDVSFSVSAGEIFGLLGPNGGGKTTLFRVLSTLLVPTEGQARVFGDDVVRRPLAARRRIGVVFQSQSLDRKLTAVENLRHQGHLYGLRGAPLRERSREMLARVGLAERAHEPVERLSGGLRRRVELAKGLLHHPDLLLLDEPSSGLDAGARRDLRLYLSRLRDTEGVTVLLTTHLLDEAQACDRLAILDRGRLLAMGSPDSLRKRIGGDVVVLETQDPESLCEEIRKRFGGEPSVLDGRVRIERAQGHKFVTDLVEAFPGRIDAVSVAKPTLEDVFIQQTGHRFWEEERDQERGKAP
ncbi:MAG: ATP-binding cassette domain-containing protein [Acidobacteria bacterium]|nr:ATP-binding cassette domain-containing protein [Acidobacteriota bacterium]